MAVKTGMEGIEGSGLLEIVQGVQQGKEKMGQGIAIDADFETRFRSYTQALSKGETGQRAEVYKGLDGVMKQGDDFRKLVGEMNVGLSRYFASYQESLGTITDKSTLEKVVSKMGPFGAAWADKRVYSRLLDQPIDTSAGQMLKHGANIAQIILREEQKMKQAYNIVQQGKLQMSEKYKEAEAGKEKWSSAYSDKERQVNELTERLSIADPHERGPLQQELDLAKIARDDARGKMDQYTVVLQRITEDAPQVEKHLDSYISIIKDLANMRTDIQQKVLHYQNVLPLVKKVIESTMAVKGADMFGEQLRAAVATATHLVTNAAMEVANTAAKTLDAKIMTPDEFAVAAQRLVKAAETYDAAIGRAEGYVQTGGNPSAQAE